MPQKRKNPLQKAIKKIKLLAQKKMGLSKKHLDLNQLIWMVNIFLFLFYLSIFIGPSFLRSSVLDYSNIKSDPFDGTVYPISYVPNWLNIKNTYKTLQYNGIPVSEFISIPRYDTSLLENTDTNNTKAILERYTYITPYMGSYRMNFQEYDGSHPAIDIRAPLGTPILAIANGVVTKVKDTDTGDGKYVVIRHDDVNIGGSIETLYSSYEHVNDIVAIEGTKVKRGDLIAHVGMTGITTTPHLHFQIDKASAPYHPYWPFTFKQASDLGLDFFSAINVGLGKENAIAYTIHPLDFVQNNLKPLTFEDSKQVLIASSPATSNDIQASYTTSINSPDISTVSGVQNTPTSNIQTNLNSAPEQTASNTSVISETPQTTSSDAKIEPIQTPTDTIVNISETDTNLVGSLFTLKDITPENRYYAAINGLVQKGVIKGYADGNFYPDRPISRREALIIVFRLFNIIPNASINTSIFRDIKKDDIASPYLNYALDKGIISPNKYYRPDDTVSRAELVKLIIQTSGIIPNISESRFNDISRDNVFFPYINTFAQIMGIQGGKFQPDVQMDRGGVANVLWAFSEKIGK